MSKKEKIENIKNVSEFYQALRNEVAYIFNSYERCGIFDGWTENQKKECFGFGTHILSNVWLPIQKHYTNKKRKKYQKIENGYEDICKRQDQQIAELQQQLAITEKALELACREITGSCEYCSYKTRIECPVEADCLDEKINYFKTKAKEMLESE